MNHTVSLRFAFLLAMVVLLVSGCQEKEEEQTPKTDLRGTWNIIGTLVTTTNPDPEAPQAGYQAPDTWVLALNNNVPNLSSGEGSVDGTLVGTGYHFEGQFDIVSGYVWVTFVIEIFPSAKYNNIYGTEEFKYWGLNGVGQTMFLGTESWKIEGTKQ